MTPRAWRAAALAAAAATVFGVFFATQTFLTARVSGGSPPWVRILKFSLAQWYLCVPHARGRLSLAPVLAEMILWAAKHEKTAAGASVIRQMTRNRDEFIAKMRNRWKAESPVSASGALLTSSIVSTPAGRVS